MNIIPLIIALIIIVVFFFILSFFRYGKSAKSREAGKSDKKTTSFITIAVITNILVLEAAFVLDYFKLFLLFNNPKLAYIGNFLMITGLMIRIIATRTLREYYTRTLKIQTDQELIDSGLYKFVRHPGYLGVIMVWTGAGLSANNYLVLAIVFLSTIITYHYRMTNEEKMLIDAFGDVYRDYKKRTKRLIPLIY